MEKIHSRNSGTGREWKKSIPEIREREGNEKNPFPKFGNGKGMKKIHSRNSGTGREWKKAIPEIREWEGNEKNPFPKFGKGIRGFHSWEWPGTGIPAHPCAKQKKNIRNSAWLPKLRVSGSGFFPGVTEQMLWEGSGYQFGLIFGKVPGGGHF